MFWKLERISIQGIWSTSTKIFQVQCKIGAFKHSTNIDKLSIRVECSHIWKIYRTIKGVSIANSPLQLSNEKRAPGYVLYMGDDKLPNYNWVVVSNIFYFHPYLGKVSILTNIFHMGWNHQLEKDPY